MPSLERTLAEGGDPVVQALAWAGDLVLRHAGDAELLDEAIDLRVETPLA